MGIYYFGRWAFTSVPASIGYGSRVERGHGGGRGLMERSIRSLPTRRSGTGSGGVQSGPATRSLRDAAALETDLHDFNDHP